MLNRKERKMAVIEMAVFNWERRLKGDYYYWEKEHFSIDFCKEQIKYFKNYKII